MEILDRYNKECAAEAYNDSYWEWSGYKNGEYYILKDNWSGDAFKVLKKEVIKIIKKEPLVFIKSRVSAFKAAAMSKNSYNLYLPLIILIVIIAESMIDRDIVLTMLGSGILCHTIFTIMLMPASYF